MKFKRQRSANLAIARSIWGPLSRPAATSLKELIAAHRFSVAQGHLQLISGKWYVTHAGLLGIAQRRRCLGIRVHQVHKFCDPSVARWVFKATVYSSASSKGFVGYGDADPSNVSSLVHGAEMRVAETRAVNRALRKAYGIGLCSVEELGWTPRQAEPQTPSTSAPVASANGHNRHCSSQPRLRDRLCLLIRQHHLDASLVKAYAAEYCGAPALRDASRESIEDFINHLAEKVAHDRDALLCHLNSYAKTQEVNP